jgi:serine/threonine-protein kinase
MRRVAGARWATLSAHLDEALDLPENERRALVAKLRAEDPRLARDLESMLDAHRVVTEQRFLEGIPCPFPDPFVAAGQEFGAYRLVSLIGTGGMGSVWLAQRTDGRFERKVAIKLLNAGLVGREAEQRFRREGSLLARLTHPHIAQLIDAGVTDHGRPYLVLEHIDGEPLDEYCDRHHLGIDLRLQLFLDVASAVSHAHSRLIVHRDLKPSNVLVAPGGGVKLLDFGIAKLLDDETDTMAPLTRDGASALTPEWAAPEQVTGDPVSTATDVYSLGNLLYVLLTGRHPAADALRSPAELVRSITETEPARLSSVAVSDSNDVMDAAERALRRATTPARLQRYLRGDLDTIVHKAVKKLPAERYASVDALADDVRRFIAREAITARRDTMRYRAGKFVQRNRAVAALTTLAIAATIAGVVGTLHQAGTARAQRDFALRQLAHVEAVNDLNEFLLTDAAPSGQRFTARELLGQAERIVAGQQGNDEMRTALLVAIGLQYWMQDEDERARRILENAYAQSRPVADASIRGRAACALASALGRSVDFPRAESLLREGMADLSNGPEHALDRMFCLLRGSAVAREEGLANVALERAEGARRELERAPLQSPILELRVHMDLAETYRVAGQPLAASAAFERAAALLGQLGRARTATAGTLYNNWALALYRLGRPLEAERILGQAIELSRADATDQGVSPMLLINYSRVLGELWRLDEAARFAERAYAMASKAGQEVVVNQSLLLRSRIYVDQGKLADAGAVLDEVEPRLRQQLPPGHIAFASLTSERGLLAQARGELRMALDLTDGAIQIIHSSVQAGNQGGDVMALLMLRRSGIELDLHMFEEAASDARSAVELLQRNTPAGTWSATLGRAYLSYGQALAAQNHRDAARQALQSAVGHLEKTFGGDHPQLVNARALLDASNDADMASLRHAGAHK